jgi:copper(I)-binding protein
MVAALLLSRKKQEKNQKPRMNRSLLVALITLISLRVDASLEMSDSTSCPELLKKDKVIVYTTLKNTSNVSYVISGISSDIARLGLIHQSYVDDKGVSRTVVLDKLLIPPMSTVYLAPGGLYIELQDVDPRVKPLDHFKINILGEGGDKTVFDLVLKTSCF